MHCIHISINALPYAGGAEKQTALRCHLLPGVDSIVHAALHSMADMKPGPGAHRVTSTHLYCCLPAARGCEWIPCRHTCSIG